MKKILFLILAISFCGIAYAQKENDNRKAKMEKAMEEIQSRKIAFFTKTLELSSEEAKVFWPVYDKCQKETYAARKDPARAQWLCTMPAKRVNPTRKSVPLQTPTMRIWRGNLPCRNSTITNTRRFCLSAKPQG